MADSLYGRVEQVGRERLVPRHLSKKAPIRHLDLSLLLVVSALSLVGAVAIYSATRTGLTSLNRDPHFFLKRQLAFLALALIAFLVMLLFDYRQLRGLAPLIYAAGLGMLILVLSPAGHTTAGAQRWINLGPLQMQPSEMTKIVLIVALAALCASERVPTGGARMVLALALTALPAALVHLQPDLGTVLLMGAIVLTVLLVAGIRGRWLAVLMAAAAAAVALVLQLGLLHDYQVARLTAFLDDKADLQLAGYNLAQSKIAIGSGGLVGKGLFRGTQTNLDYVPHQHTDFIFTVIGEEMGFVGSLAVVGLFSFLSWRCLRIAVLSKDRFGTYLAAGIAGMFVFQTFVNIGMTIGIIPITGIPLPFVSYGGSSLLTSFMAAGLLMNVHMRRFV
ncbi:MAG: rod shape-determining protein RodA [Actinomycetota bacterium]